MEEHPSGMHTDTGGDTCLRLTQNSIQDCRHCHQTHQNNEHLTDSPTQVRQRRHFADGGSGSNSKMIAPAGPAKLSMIVNMLIFNHADNQIFDMVKPRLNKCRVHGGRPRSRAVGAFTNSSRMTSCAPT
ncbi:hypothetical protein CAL36_02305 [Enterobacter kobei]|nr:hypothetical protein CAL36_02305 [Enterobacter kobei]